MNTHTTSLDAQDNNPDCDETYAAPRMVNGVTIYDACPCCGYTVTRWTYTSGGYHYLCNRRKRCGWDSGKLEVQT